MLSFKDLAVLSCKSLIANKVRSTLTTLGVFMGVGAVNATLQVGDISTAILAQQLAERGTPRVQIANWSSEGINLSLEDMNYLQRSIKNIAAISAKNNISYGDEKAFFKTEEAEPEISAVTQDYLETTEIKLLKGRFFNSQDFLQYRPVIVIDNFLADKLFKTENPLGKQLLTYGRLYAVVGIIETEMGFSEPTGKILLPFSRYTATTGIERIRLISIRPRNTEKMEELKTIAQELLQKRLPGIEIYAYSNIEDIIETQKTLEIASAGLTFVGMISLLIGGVGITNITIAAVIERTAEIGLRRAIGATKYEILCQFIIEAAILSLVGGITAVTTIHIITTVVTEMFSLPYQFEVKTVSLSLGSAVLVGVGAAFFPSLRASQLDPVKALRQS